jgi:hypothetical protein
MKTLHQFILEFTTPYALAESGYQYICRWAMVDYVKQYRLGYVLYNIATNPCNGRWDWYQADPTNPYLVDALAESFLTSVDRRIDQAIPAILDPKWLGSSILPSHIYHPSAPNPPELVQFEGSPEAVDIFRICGGNHRKLASTRVLRLVQDHNTKHPTEPLNPPRRKGKIGVFLLRLYDKGEPCVYLLYPISSISLFGSHAGELERRGSQAGPRVSVLQQHHVLP